MDEVPINGLQQQDGINSKRKIKICVFSTELTATIKEEKKHNLQFNSLVGSSKSTSDASFLISRVTLLTYRCQSQPPASQWLAAG